MKFSYVIGEQEVTVTLEKVGGDYKVTIGENSYQVAGVSLDNGLLQFTLDGEKISAHTAAEKNKRWIAVQGKTYQVEKPLAARRRRGGMAGGSGAHIAPMPGQVREVLVAEGDTVEQGQTLLLLEAMKMEIRIQASMDGTVQTLNVAVGQQVNKDDVLLALAAVEG